MFTSLFRDSTTVLDPYKKHAHIKDYTDNELFEALEIAEEVPTTVLAVICAEVLLRLRGKNEI